MLNRICLEHPHNATVNTNPRQMVLHRLMFIHLIYMGIPKIALWEIHQHSLSIKLDLTYLPPLTLT